MASYLYSRYPKRHRQSAGYTMITFTVSSVVVLGMVGLAVDVGRAFISKSESQAFTDSASLAAALELDGTPAGLDRARAQVTGNTNKWNFNTSSFGTVTTSFATSAAGPWDTNPASATGYYFVKTATTVSTPTSFIGVFRALTPLSSGAQGSTYTMNVASSSVAGQVAKTTFSEGIFPFSPYAHSATGPNYGLTPGQLYTVRWPANAKIDNNVCAGDNDATTIALAGAGGGSERGYIEDTSASVLRQAIEGGYQTVTRTIGDTVNMTGGAKGTERTAITDRIATDTNPSAADYATYVASGTGNGQRVVAMPINTGAPDYTIVQIGAFFLLPASNYGNGGNTQWCAEYIGAYVQGGKARANDSGTYVVRLVQ